MNSLPSTVLFFTYAEYGQSNVVLATAYELALSGMDVCIASTASLRARVSRIQELVVRHAAHASRLDSKHTGSVHLYECQGDGSRVERLELAHPGGVSGALQSYYMLDTLLFPHSPEEYLASIEDCKAILSAVKPDAVVVELRFRAALDACTLAGQKFIVISPLSLKELALGQQPSLAALWKYPAVSSGFPFPLEWWQVPLNVYLLLRFILKQHSVNVKQVQALRGSLGLELHRRYDDIGPFTKICPALPEADFPMEFIPEDMVLCGPIVMPFDPVEECDPVLAEWLNNGPTVMINLGTLVVSDGKAAKETASACRILLDHHARKGAKTVQVLWKLRAGEDVRVAIDEIIGKEIREERVKVLSWMEVEPVSVLQHSNLVCTVHHGGANSFFEGVWSGIPHIALPVWYDTYTCASCVEYLKIGIFGNKTSAPSVCAEEFGDALVRVTGDGEETKVFRRSAKRLKEVCRAKGNGRKLASMAILKEAGIDK